MLDFPVYMHIRCKKNKKLSHREIYRQLHRFDYKTDGYHILFLTIKENFANILNGTSMIPFCIIFSAAWANELIDCNEEVENAFILSIGHELGHKHCGDYWCLCKRKADCRFRHWVNEVQHDFYASKYMVNGNLTKTLSAMEYKRNYKIKYNKEDIDTSTHPSWEHRIEYIKKGKFDSKLIEQIAKDTGCKDEKLINKLKRNYLEEIELK